MIAYISMARNLALLLFVCFTFSILLFNTGDARGEVASNTARTNQDIMLARQFAECSGAYYASSEAVEIMRGESDTSAAFREKGNGYLLAAAWQLNRAEPSHGFKDAFARAETRTDEIKEKWMQHIANQDHAGVGDINKTTEICASRLSGRQQAILQNMRRIEAGQKK